MLAYAAVVFLQMLLLFGVANALFGMPLGDSPIGLLSLTLALALAATGLGILLGSVARSAKEARSIGIIVPIAIYFASGFTDITISPKGYSAGLEGFRYYLSQTSPQTYAIDGYVRLMIEGVGMVDLLPNILVLLGFGIVFFLIGLWRFKYE
jgi:ABC-2 type transport system permease protein